MLTNNSTPTLFLSDLTRRRLLSKLGGATSLVFLLVCFQWELTEHKNEARQQIIYLRKHGFTFLPGRGAKVLVSYDAINDPLTAGGSAGNGTEREVTGVL